MEWVEVPIPHSISERYQVKGVNFKAFVSRDWKGAKIIRISSFLSNPSEVLEEIDHSVSRRELKYLAKILPKVQGYLFPNQKFLKSMGENPYIVQIQNNKDTIFNALSATYALIEFNYGYRFREWQLPGIA